MPTVDEDGEFVSRVYNQNGQGECLWPEMIHVLHSGSRSRVAFVAVVTNVCALHAPDPMGANPRPPGSLVALALSILGQPQPGVVADWPCIIVPVCISPGSFDLRTFA